jgi:peptidoglycan hydrolase-like protein with peptidoglycan-binding domain
MRARAVAVRVGVVAVAVGAAVAGLAGPASASTTVRDIGYGSSNHHGVWCVQAAINNWKGKKVLAEDGDFGSNTLTWVKNFQYDHGLKRDGIVGKHTGDDIWTYDYYSIYCYDRIPTTF